MSRWNLWPVPDLLGSSSRGPPHPLGWWSSVEEPTPGHWRTMVSDRQTFPSCHQFPSQTKHMSRLCAPRLSTRRPGPHRRHRTARRCLSAMRLNAASRVGSPNANRFRHSQRSRGMHATWSPNSKVRTRDKTRKTFARKAIGGCDKDDVMQPLWHEYTIRFRRCLEQSWVRPEQASAMSSW
jgi:hypothetical protein